MPSTSLNFEGIGNFEQYTATGYFAGVPDTNGDVGPNHYIQWVNKSFSIWDKSGNKLKGPVAGNSLWKGFGGLCETSNDGDPIVQYDSLADRWVMTQFAFNGRDAYGRPASPYSQCFAVSRTADPLGAWNLYSWRSTSTLEGIPKFNDYAKLGVWPDGYYLTFNQYIYRANGTNGSAGQGLLVLPRDKMIAGDPISPLYWDFDPALYPTYFTMLPGDLDGPSPPTGSPNWVARFWDGIWGTYGDSLLISKVVVDWANPSQSGFYAPDVLSVAPFDARMCNFDQSCIPQLGTTTKLDPSSDRMMYRLQYRNFGTHQSLVLNHTVDENSADHAGIRWY
jgi:hypothetical protein